MTATKCPKCCKNDPMGGWLVQVVSNGGFLLGSHRTFSITTNYLGHETFYSMYCMNVIAIHNNHEKQLYLWFVGMCSDNIMWRLSCLFSVAVYSWRAVWGHDILPWHICWCTNCRQTCHCSVFSWRFHHSLLFSYSVEYRSFALASGLTLDSIVVVLL